MRGRHRDLIHATSSVGSIYAEATAGVFVRRFAAVAERRWDVSHPIGYWRGDGSVYAGRSAPASGRGWISGFLGPMALIGVAGAGIYRYGRPDSEPASPEVIARDVRDLFITGVNSLYRIASMNKDATLISDAAPIDQSIDAGAPMLLAMAWQQKHPNTDRRFIFVPSQACPSGSAGIHSCHLQGARQGKPPRKSPR